MFKNLNKTTKIHSYRVTLLSRQLGILLGFNKKQIRELSMNAILHDIGKVNIPNEILDAPRKLTEEEKILVSSHVLFYSDNVKKYLIGIRYHHTRYDQNSGIHIYAKIIQLCDVVEALTSKKRTYKEAFSIDQTIKYVKENTGTQFDPELASLFIDNIDFFRDILENQ